MKIAWCTDLHLNFCDDQSVEEFIDRLGNSGVAAVLISGDISTGHLIGVHLKKIAAVDLPIYFCLGNHDFYGGSFSEIDRIVNECCRQCSNLHHLGQGEIIQLTTDTTLVGHRGWADGRAGAVSQSRVWLNDFEKIQDLKLDDPNTLFSKLAALGSESAIYFSEIIPRATAQSERVVVLTHIPAFPQAACHNGRMSDPEYLPHFCNVAGGQAILWAAEEQPEKQIHVLCGHTHEGGVVEIRTNLQVKTGGATYGQPKIWEILDL